ncbi:MAG TPA: sigma-70 family RNA polymerase sigma factor [Phycisphaerae bacterium]|nr:sigma-70 family RNA polymerase sigma factor [Phycisphaerae bacterium]HRW53902.1 sigma-70 family RNA polymerase sigma factor [Phycisphaerae bacterium]
MTLSPEAAAEFRGLYDQFAPLVRSLAYDRLRDWHGAWDVVHDVFLALIQEMRRGGRQTIAQAWIVKVARNKIVDRVRLDQRRRERGRVDASTPDLSIRPDEQRQLEQLHAAIADLPENERLIVWLFYLDGLSAQRVGALTGVPVRTVYARLARARRSLRTALTTPAKEVC